MLASSEGVSVYFNDKKLPIKKFSDYTKLFKLEKESVSITEEDGSSEVTIAFVERDGKKKPISFVNGLFTKHGGQHVDGWTKPFFANLLSVLNKPSKTYKDLKLSLKDVTHHILDFLLNRQLINLNVIVKIKIC